MFQILPFILLLLSLFVIVILIYKNFNKLILLDVNSLPEIREQRKKDYFIRKKAEKKNSDVYIKLLNRLKPVHDFFYKKAKKIQKKFRIYFIEIKNKIENYEKNKPRTTEEKEKIGEDIKNLEKEARKDLSKEDLETAEKKYLAILKQDSQNKEAYKGLADVYYNQGQISEAKETYHFVLKLDENDYDVYLKLANIAESEGRIEKAIEYYEKTLIANPNNASRFFKIFELFFSIKEYNTALEAIKQALEIEPDNPKYLDNFLEISIVLNKKALALEVYNRLRMNNPENQKLDIFKQRIDELKK